MTCLPCRCPDIRFWYSESRKATELSTEVQQLIDKGNFDSVGYIERPDMPLLPQHFEKFESRSLTLKRVLETLKDSEVNIIAICGMPGVGKTKMVNEIAERVKVDKSFDEVAMAVVSQPPDSIKIQGELAYQLGLKDLGDIILRRAERLCKRLGQDDQRILIILDDLWAKVDLDSLWKHNNVAKKGLKVLLTSRFRDVCGEMGAQRIIEVEILNWTESWLLFKEISKIFDDADDDLKHTSEEVAKECGGLPLAIVCIGGSLKNKKKHAWKVVLRQLQNSSVTTIEGKKNLVTSRIQLSYESLEDNDYKSLFLLCSLFPEDADIPIEILVRYVKGLQMFKEVEKLNEIRDKVDTIVDHLKGCYLLLSSGRHRNVKLHDVVRDVCLSIASEGEHVFMSRHAELIEWPQDISSLKNFTAISVTFKEMNQLPTGLQHPRLRLLRLAGRQKNLPNIPIEGMKDLRVLQLKRLPVQNPLLLQCLTSLRTLCLEKCIFETETSIGCLKQLEVLSFYGSTLVCFPKEVSELTNLQLLDLRSKEGHRHSFPSGIFSGLKKLEELYMGSHGPENKEAKQSWITEVSSLSHLTSLQMCTDGTEILLQFLRGLVLEKMERFNIHNSVYLGEWEYELQKNLALSGIEARTLTEDSLSLLLKKTETLRLHRFQGLRNLVPELAKDGLNNLKELDVGESPDLEYIIDATSMVPKYGLRNLEKLYLQNENLKGLCYGSIQPPWLCNLKTVEVTNCDAMTSFVPQSISKCLVHLQHLEFGSCGKLEEVITMEENTVVEFLNLKTLNLYSLPNFKEFCSGNQSPSLFSQVSLPALEALEIYGIINCPQQVVGGCNLPNGSFHKLKSIEVRHCYGVECITKADSVKLLQDLTKIYVSRCDNLQGIFDLEGLKSTEDRLVLLPRLDSLGLYSLPKLASIWKMFPKRIQAFQGLRVLEVQGCTRIKYLLSPPSLAKMLVSLEKLTIGECDSMEEVICGSQVIEGEEVDDDDHTSNEFKFPNLQSIDFYNLEKLKSFGSGGEDHELIFPSLTELGITECPQLQKFFHGKLSAPMLQKVLMGQDDIVPVDLKREL